MSVVHMGTPLITLVQGLTHIHSSGQFTEGEFVHAFEQEVEHLYEQYAVSFNSCGTALFSVMRKLPKGTWIVPNNTFYATAAMVKEAGNDIVLADCGLDDFCINYLTLQLAYKRAKIQGKEVVGVVLTHVGGNLALDYEEIAKFCDENEMYLIEDAAHAFGATKNTPTGVIRAGSLGEAAVFSFYPTKAVPVGEGGVAITADKYLCEELKSFRNYGKVPLDNGKTRYEAGFNFRMSEWDAMIALRQVQRLPEILELRESDFHMLSQIIPTCRYIDGRSNHYKYAVRAEKAKELGITRFTGSIYSYEDQIATIFGLETTFVNSIHVAEGHRCLPIGEGMYRRMSRDWVLKYLQGEAL